MRIDNKKFLNYIIWGIFIAVLILVTVIRLRMLNTPLERDEGEYAYIGQQWLLGKVPFESAYSMKLPGTAGIYALLFLIFGQSVAAIHLGLLIFSLASTICLTIFATKLFSQMIGVFSGIFFVLFSLAEWVLGYAAQSEHFLIFFVLLSFVVLLKATKNNKLWLYFISGLFLGLSILMKQHAVYFGLWSLVFIFLKFSKKLKLKIILKIFAAFLLGVLLPVVVIIFLIWQGGAIKEFWFWTFSYSKEYLKLMTINDGLRSLLGNFLTVLKPNLVILLISVLAVFNLIKSKRYQEKRKLMWLLLIVSFLAFGTGLYFRPHYLILMLPILAIFCGVGFELIYKYLIRQHPESIAILLILLLFFLSIGQILIVGKGYYFKWNQAEIVKNTFSSNVFSGSKAISEYLNVRLNPEDKFVVIGSEPEIYFYTKKTSITRYLYYYPFIEKQKYSEYMTKEFINEVIRANPRYLIYIREPGAWGLPNNKSTGPILNWLKDYINQNKYFLVAGVNLLTDDNLQIVLKSQGTDFEKLGSRSIELYEKQGS